MSLDSKLQVTVPAPPGAAVTDPENIMWLFRPMDNMGCSEFYKNKFPIQCTF